MLKKIIVLEPFSINSGALTRSFLHSLPHDNSHPLVSRQLSSLGSLECGIAGHHRHQLRSAEVIQCGGAVCWLSFQCKGTKLEVGFSRQSCKEEAQIKGSRIQTFSPICCHPTALTQYFKPSLYSSCIEMNRASCFNSPPNIGHGWRCCSQHLW